MRGSVSWFNGPSRGTVRVPRVCDRSQLSSKIEEFLAEAACVVGNLVDAILTLFTGVLWLVIAAATGGVTLWFSWLLLFGG